MERARAKIRDLRASLRDLRASLAAAEHETACWKDHATNLAKENDDLTRTATRGQACPQPPRGGSTCCGRDLRVSLRAAEHETASWKDHAANLAKENDDLTRTATRGQACPQPPRGGSTCCGTTQLVLPPYEVLWYDPRGMTEVPVCGHPADSLHQTCYTCQAHFELMEMKSLWERRRVEQWVDERERQHRAAVERGERPCLLERWANITAQWGLTVEQWVDERERQARAAVQIKRRAPPGAPDGGPSLLERWAVIEARLTEADRGGQAQPLV